MLFYLKIFFDNVIKITFFNNVTLCDLGKCNCVYVYISLLKRIFYFIFLNRFIVKISH